MFYKKIIFSIVLLGTLIILLLGCRTRISVLAETNDFASQFMSDFFSYNYEEIKEQITTNDDNDVFIDKYMDFCNSVDEDLNSGKVFFDKCQFVINEEDIVLSKNKRKATINVCYSMLDIDGFEADYDDIADFTDLINKVESVANDNCDLQLIHKGKKWYVDNPEILLSIVDKCNQSVGTWNNKVEEIKAQKKKVLNIKPGDKLVALTFDDGPVSNPNATAKMINILKENNAHATFFVNGYHNDPAGVQPTAGFSDFLNDVIEANCEIGNHTYSHSNCFPKLSLDEIKDDINKNAVLVEECTGVRPTLVRTPGGYVNSEIVGAVGATFINWSIDPVDWKNKDANIIHDKVMGNVYDGAIVLSHDVYPTTVEAYERIVPELINEGYKLVTVSELIEAKCGQIETGKMYFSASNVKSYD